MKEEGDKEGEEKRREGGRMNLGAEEKMWRRREGEG